MSDGSRRTAKASRPHDKQRVANCEALPNRVERDTVACPLHDPAYDVLATSP